MQVKLEQSFQVSGGIASREGRLPARQTIRVVEIDFRSDHRYEDFIRDHAGSCIFHHPGWLDALEEEYGAKCDVLASENSNGELEAVLPLATTRGLPFRVGRQQIGRRLSSLPRTPIAGPVFTAQDSVANLLRAAVQRAIRSNLQLQLKSQLTLPTEALTGCVRTTWRPTYVLAIPKRKEELRFGDARNRHNIKWAVNKALKQGLRVRRAESESDLESWYPLYLEAMRRNVVPPRSFRLFSAMWKNLVSQGLMTLRLAEQEQRDEHPRLVAGSIFLTFRDTTWYAFTGIRDSDLGLHANDLILWHAINDACGTCVSWFDFGEVSEDHPELTRFKTKWGAQPREQYRYYSGERLFTTPAHSESRGAVKLVNRMWPHLPLRVTQALGDVIYSRL
jgi:CelD/BcsL family acetyltransferase involved in cellulose biosynthesis